MFSSLLTKVGAVIAGVGITVAGWIGLTPKSTFQEELLQVRKQIVQVQQELASEPKLGAVNAVQAQKFNLAGSGITANATSIVLQSFKLPDASTTISMSDLGTIAYGTLEPGTTKEEQISFTGVTQNGNGTATLTGVTRGLSFLASSCAETTANKKSHAGGTIFVLSNTACFYSNFAITSNTTTISAPWTFTSEPKVPTPTNASSAVNKAYADGLAIAGAPDASLTQKGIAEIATSAELGNGLSTGDTSAPLVPRSTSFSSSTSATTTVPVTQANGTLRPGFIDQSGAYNWIGAHSFGSSTTFTATSTFASSTVHSGSTSFTGPVTFSNTISGINASTTLLAVQSTGGFTTSSTISYTFNTPFVPHTTVIHYQLNGFSTGGGAQHTTGIAGYTGNTLTFNQLFAPQNSSSSAVLTVNGLSFGSSINPTAGATGSSGAQVILYVSTTTASSITVAASSSGAGIAVNNPSAAFWVQISQ